MTTETASRFAKTRDENRQEIAEDYVERIHVLIDQQNEARAADLVRYFGVSAATVNNIINRLKLEGLVQTAPYRALFLTPAGKQLALHCLERHRTIERFLIALGVDAETAGNDAEGIEHHVSNKTLLAFSRFLMSQNEKRERQV